MPQTNSRNFSRIHTQQTFIKTSPTTRIIYLWLISIKINEKTVGRSVTVSHKIMSRYRNVSTLSYRRNYLVARYNIYLFLTRLERIWVSWAECSLPIRWLLTFYWYQVNLKTRGRIYSEPLNGAYTRYVSHRVGFACRDGKHYEVKCFVDDQIKLPLFIGKKLKKKINKCALDKFALSTCVSLWLEAQKAKSNPDYAIIQHSQGIQHPLKITPSQERMNEWAQERITKQ